MEAFLFFGMNFAIPEPEPQRPRAVSSFYPVWGVAIPPLAPGEPYTTSIILPFDERSQQETEDEVQQGFDSIFEE